MEKVISPDIKSKPPLLRDAFIKSVPVLFGYIFIGTAFGILLQQAGYNYVWAFFISLVVFAGSMQFVLVTFLSHGTALSIVAVMTLVINSRHIFYGLSFVEIFKKMRWKYPYMIFSLTDETYSVLCSLNISKDIATDTDKKNVMFLIALFNQAYWITGSVIGALIGQLIPFNFKGIDFSMTALFVVIFIEQWMSFKSHLPAIAGLCSSVLLLLLLGPEHFILPSLIVTVAVLMACKNIITQKMEVE